MGTRHRTAPPVGRPRSTGGHGPAWKWGHEQEAGDSQRGTAGEPAGRTPPCRTSRLREGVRRDLSLRLNAQFLATCYENLGSEYFLAEF